MPKATRRTVMTNCYVCDDKLYADQEIHTGIVKEVPWHHEYFCPECWTANPDVHPEPTDWDTYCESKGLLCRRDHHHVCACYRTRSSLGVRVKAGEVSKDDGQLEVAARKAPEPVKAFDAVTTWECGYCHAVFDKSKEADQIVPHFMTHIAVGTPI